MLLPPRAAHFILTTLPQFTHQGARRRGAGGAGELLQAEFGGWGLLDWAALVAFGVQEAQTNFRARCAGRYDDAAIAVVEDDVGAVGFGEAWCAFDDMTAEQKSSETVPVAFPSSLSI